MTEKPQLKWDGPDDEGDYLVTVVNVDGFGPQGLTVHGATVEQALHVLGSFLEAVFEEHCPDCSTHKPADEAIPVSPTPDWQPIETAPKDGTRLLLYPGMMGYAVVGRRSLTHRCWETLPGKYGIHPTHWHPMLASPVPAVSPTPKEQKE